MARKMRRWRSLGDKPLRCIRYGDFMCDTHWRVVTESQAGPDPIYSASLQLGLTCWLYVNNYPLGKTVRHACCRLPQGDWKGLVERSRPSYWSTQ